MSDDVFIREVNEEIRQDKAKALWDRFGPFVIGLALLVIAGTEAPPGASRVERPSDLPA